MGQAKQRGTLEQRVALAKHAEATRLAGVAENAQEALNIARANRDAAEPDSREYARWERSATYLKQVVRQLAQERAALN